MDQTKAVEPKPRHIDVVHEVLPLKHQRVFGVPVAANGKNRASATLNGNDIWTSNVIIRIIEAVDNHIDVNLVNTVTLVVSNRVAAFLRFPLFNISVEWLWVA